MLIFSFVLQRLVSETFHFKNEGENWNFSLRRIGVKWFTSKSATLKAGTVKRRNGEMVENHYKS